MRAPSRGFCELSADAQPPPNGPGGPRLGDPVLSDAVSGDAVLGDAVLQGPLTAGTSSLGHRDRE